MRIYSGDFTTPEGAILKLEEAYRARDLEAAIACKDFVSEAKLLLRNLPDPSLSNDAEIVAETARVLELSYVKMIREQGFPNMTGVTSHFTNRERAPNGIVIVTEVCRWGTISSARADVQY